ncbi:hypothetical protein HMPREF1548_04879 [Clostridium sp. KLE 1755]|nr:hypothetical protein HMPREF1548_04879 [Clostridium sp. KLE 1755]
MSIYFLSFLIKNVIFPFPIKISFNYMYIVYNYMNCLIIQFLVLLFPIPT